MNLIIRRASVSWKGGAQGGSRSITTEGSLLRRAKLSPGLSVKNDSETDPAELIAAAHASSFSLALSQELGLKISARGEMVTAARMTLERLAAGWMITDIHLNVVARLPGVTQNRFIDATVRAKTNCLVSRLLGTNILMIAKLEK